MNTGRILERLEFCSLCDEPTGNTGEHEDSIYLAINTPAQIGPLCQTCRNTILSEEIIEINSSLADKVEVAEQFAKQLFISDGWMKVQFREDSPEFKAFMDSFGRDNLEHSLSEDCWCLPEIIDGLVVHRRTDN